MIVLSAPEPNVPSTIRQDERWPVLASTFRQAQDIMATVDPPRIPKYLAHPCLDTIHAMGTYYPIGHRKGSNPFSWLIRKAKKGDRASLDILCLLLVDFLASTVRTPLPIDLILDVPTDPRRLKERGFSIPEALATAVSRRLGVPISDCLILTRPVGSLRELSPEERAAELIDAFALSDPAQVEKKRILIVDDVIAYGTTAAQIASLLRAKGAQSVSLAVLAKAARVGGISPRLRVRSGKDDAGL